MANNLLKGLSILYDMELNNYLMLQTINKLNNQINSLGNRRNIKLPNYQRTQSVLDTLRYDFFPIFGIGCGVLGGIIGVGKGVTVWIDDFFAPVKYGIKYLILLFLAGLVLDVLFLVILPKIKGDKYNKRYNKKEKRRYQTDLTNDEIRIQQEIIQRDILINQRDLMINKQKESYRNLVRFYNMMGIDENYRNLIPIGYMYEFCRLGISNKFGGADGLYYLVRKEIRYDRMQFSLEEISSKLDTIISNQSKIYFEINSINNKCNNLIAQTKKSAELAAKNNQLVSVAVKNTSISNYHLQRLQTEVEYQNTMKWIHNKW